MTRSSFLEREDGTYVDVARPGGPHRHGRRPRPGRARLRRGRAARPPRQQLRQRAEALSQPDPRRGDRHWVRVVLDDPQTPTNRHGLGCAGPRDQCSGRVDPTAGSPRARPTRHRRRASAMSGSAPRRARSPSGCGGRAPPRALPYRFDRRRSCPHCEEGRVRRGWSVLVACFVLATAGCSLPEIDVRGQEPAPEVSAVLDGRADPELPPPGPSPEPRCRLDDGEAA